MKIIASIFATLAATLLPTTDVSAQAATTPFGTSCGGTVLGASNLPLIPSTNFSIDITNGPANGTAVLILDVLGFTPTPFGPCEIYFGPTPVDLLLPTLDASGAFSLPVPISGDTGAIGLQFMLQIITVDPTQTMSFGLGFSNGLEVRLDVV